MSSTVRANTKNMKSTKVFESTITVPNESWTIKVKGIRIEIYANDETDPSFLFFSDYLDDLIDVLKKTKKKINAAKL